MTYVYRIVCLCVYMVGAHHTPSNKYFCLLFCLPTLEVGVEKFNPSYEANPLKNSENLPFIQIFQGMEDSSLYAFHSPKESC